MKKFEVDIPVMILFFNRPDTLKQVFEAVRKARPSVLLLAQDGARENRPTDAPLVEECRKIVEDIDWECTIYRNYSDVNLSCDHREFTAITWAFEYVDRLMILEDDCVPCPSFFPFCAELLEKYKDDSRVDRICGFNRLEKYDDVESDYFFSTISSGYGWATWKRCWDEIAANSHFEFLADRDLCFTYEQSREVIADRNYGDMLEQCRKCVDKDMSLGKISSWEILVGVYSVLNHKLIITPKYNMVRNVGAVPGSTHYADLKYVNASVRRMMLMNSYDISFPIKHPNHVIRNAHYEKKHYKAIHKNPVQKFFMKVSVALKRLIGGDFGGIGKAIKRRFSH